MAHNNGTKASEVVIDHPVEEAEDPPRPLADQETKTESTSKVVEMQASAQLAEAGRGILYHQLHRLRKATPVAQEGSDPEGVHDMRVATRRLRAALKLLGETVYDPQVTDRFRQQLRVLANALGETRDTDVFLLHLNEYIAQQPEAEREGLEPLRQELLGHLALSRKIMLKSISRKKTEKLLEKLEKFATTPDAGLAKSSVSEAEVAPTLVRHFAGSIIWRRYEELLAYETCIEPQTPVAVLHRLRVACKRLRYTLEFFQDALPANGFKVLHRQLVAVQDELGELHDHQVALELAETLLQTNPDDAALQAYHASRVAERDRIQTAFPKLWQTLSGSAYRKQLATALAGMPNSPTSSLTAKVADSSEN
jgi:triphosphatase